MKRQRAMYQMKEQDKTPEEQLNEVEIGNLPEKEFRIVIVKMIQDLRKRMEAKIEKMQEMFNKDLEELKNKQTEMNNTITEIKTTLEGINSRITEAEERISYNHFGRQFGHIYQDLKHLYILSQRTLLLGIYSTKSLTYVHKNI